MDAKKVRVLSYSGYRGEESPRAFVLNGEKIQVESVLDMWIEEGRSRERKRFFKIKGGDGFTYILYNDELSKEWFLSG